MGSKASKSKSNRRAGGPLAWLLPGLARGKPGISGLFCSQLGHEWTSQEMYDVNRRTVFDGVEERSVELYEKLLLNEPSRARRFVRPYDEIVATSDPAERAEHFKQVSLDLMEDASKGVFEQTGLDPDEIDFLVVNYMAGKTLPSLAALISGRLGLRTDCEHVNLGDMGCSAAVASLDVAVRMLLSEKKPGRALVLALEPVSNLFQKADDKGAIVGNTLFGEGCAAVVVSTHKEPMLYEIGARQRVVKADEEGVGAITLAWNEQGPMIQLSKSIPKVAGKAIEDNLKRLVPRIISPLDKLKYVLTRKVPRWQKRISRWAIHPGGTAVLRGFQKQLKLADADLGPSYKVFHERSNMSSPSVLYALDNVERSAPERGENVLMMSFGSGFKVNSMLLKKGKKKLYEKAERFAVVVGGTSGIGLESARTLTRQGYHTFIGSRRVSGPEGGYEKLDNATYLPLDVTNPESVDAFVDEVWRRSYGVDVVVVSSGIAAAGQLLGRQDASQIVRCVNTNLTGAMLVVNQLIPKMRVNGQVVLLNSILGQIPLMGSAVYCATKAGLKHFAESVEVELARAGRGVRITNLYPAYVKTPMLEEVQSGGRTFLAPIPAEKVVHALSRSLEGRPPAKGFVLTRDRLIAALYWWLPGTFKKLVASM
jgi:predicted naringenin-chalcone synthase/NAD(P)-dependent dehydrogenase (short-subunit alcohol dehydrogenase family)